MKPVKSQCHDHPSYPHDHTHTCRHCQVTWGHTEGSFNCDQCHSCPQCGRQIWHHTHPRDLIPRTEQGDALARILEQLFR